MSNEYIPQIHSYVLIDHPTKDLDQREAWSGAFAIVLHTGTHVWVMAGFGHELGQDIKPVRLMSEPANCYDQDGNCVVAVPVSLIRRYLTDQEAHELELAIYADSKIG